MRSADLLLDAFGRVQEAVHGAVEGLSEDELAERIDEEANSIAWLVWHLTRIQDDHVAGVFGTEQVWTEGGWKARFALPFSARATGYGHSSSQVAKVRASAELLLGYYDAVHERSLEHLGNLTDADLDRVVDEAWDPPVTLGVRLVSVVAEDNQHAGQAAFVRGVVERRERS
ncbi:DinB family protein [Streptomyces sp. NPDC046237]|uniref:mycothiol transferase n=1 Tax=Streptomyces sp. NPDC046237 TaxID=3154914 RepID=UPI0033C56784